MFFFDSSYILFVLPALMFAMYAQAKVRAAYEEYSRVYARSGRRGWEAAAILLNQAGLGHVRIERIPGELRDHYDPRTQTLRLSAGTYDSPSVAALGIAAHEVGHAIQHAVGYQPLAIREGIQPVVSFTSNAAIPLFFLGLIFRSGSLMDIGLLFFLGAVIFQIITLPVEYNASSRAKEMLTASGILAVDEIGPVNSVLSAAALTYVAATAMAIGQFLRLLMIRGRRD